jgi:uncharacterized protein
MLEFIKQPWHWAVAGIMIGLTVPTLLLIGNKSFGLSSNLRHICAACFPANISFFRYDWKKEAWNLYFAAGIILGGAIGSKLLTDPNIININPNTIADLKALGVSDFQSILPADIFGTENIFTWKGLVFLVIGGFMVGFGTRYANGCTSGHAIMGISALSWTSLLATICFMAGGFVMTHFGFPIIFSLFK